MASISDQAELVEAAVAGISRVPQAIAIISTEDGPNALQDAEQNCLRTAQDFGHAEASPLQLYLSEDLLRYLAGEAKKSGRSLSCEIVRRLLHSRAQDAQQCALRQIEWTATAVESTLEAVQQLLTLVQPPSAIELSGPDHGGCAKRPGE